MPRDPNHDPAHPPPLDPGRSDTAVRRLRIVVSGVVQGVVFRPFVYRLATSLRVSGWVRNDPAGVTTEVEGFAAAVDAFRHRLLLEAPPLSAIEACETDELVEQEDDHARAR